VTTPVMIGNLILCDRWFLVR